MKAYKLRAECLNDVIQLILTNKEKKQFFNPINITSSELDGCDLDFQSNSTLEEIRSTIATLDDGHVMSETVALREDYTGER